MKKVAVIGGGISGLVSAYVLAKDGVNVVIYEKEDYLGGHAKTVNVDGVDVDLGFMVFNRVISHTTPLAFHFSVSIVQLPHTFIKILLFLIKIELQVNPSFKISVTLSKTVKGT